MSTSTSPTEHADRVPSTSTRAKTILSRGQAAGGLVGLGSSADEVGLGGDSSPRLDKSGRLAAPAPGEVDRAPAPPGAGSTVRMPLRAARGAEPAPDTPAAARPRTSVETLSSFSFPSSFSSSSPLQGGTYTPATLAAEIAELDRSIAEAERSLAHAAAAHRGSLARQAHAGATPHAGPYVPIAVTRFDDDGDEGRRRSERVVCGAPPQTPAPAPAAPPSAPKPAAGTSAGTPPSEAQLHDVGAAIFVALTPVYGETTGKITGMLLESDIAELKQLLADPGYLATRAAEAHAIYADDLRRRALWGLEPNVRELPRGPAQPSGGAVPQHGASMLWPGAWAHLDTFGACAATPWHNATTSGAVAVARAHAGNTGH